MQTTLILFLTVASIYFVQKLLAYVSAVRSIQNLPGCRVLLSHTTPLGYVLPRIPGISRGNNQFFEDKYTVFESTGWDATSIVYALPQVVPTVVLADAAAIKEVTSSRARFPKPSHEYELISFFGRNIVVAEGDEWKKYRKISAPAFSDRNNKLVWDAAVEIMDGLFNEVWAGKDVISVDHALELTLPIALFVISVAAFGKKMSWNEDSTVIPKGHQVSIKDAVHVVSSEMFAKLIFPDWSLKLTKRLQTVKTGFEEFQMYMSEMIKERKGDSKIQRHDLFSNLVEANDENSDIISLTNSELIGNVFMFMLAGHETTAHTLCFTFALLALYPDEQERLYKHILSVLPDGRTPTYQEMSLFKYSMCVLYETLRMFPPVVNIPKTSEGDTTLTVGNAKGEKLTIPVPKGARITIATPALHYNPRYWKDPHSFKPERFLEDWPKDAFLPFSAGPRSCLGRKFFETEAIVILSMLVSRYKITIKEEPQFTGETVEQRKNRVLKCWNGLTLTPIRVPLTFTRRT